MPLFWIGQGVITHKGKPYGYGKELPADMPKETIASLLKKGKVTENAGRFTVPQAGPTAADMQAAIQRIEQLEKALADERSGVAKLMGINDSRLKELESVRAELETVKAELATQIELVNALTAPQGETPAAAGPGKTKK